MAKIDLELFQHILKGTDSQAGNGYLEYYEKHNVFHPGIDLNKGTGDYDLGLPITCPAEGEVIFVSRKGTNGGFGLHIVIKHQKLGMYSHWLHLDDVKVVVGDKIGAGQYIANLGKSGTQYAHLHLEVYGEDHQKLMKERDYKFYPSGQTKPWVTSHYINPAEFVRQGIALSKAVSGTNLVEIYLFKDENSPRIYLKGKDGLFHHIESENVFKAFFGGFNNVQWEQGPMPKPELIGFSLK